MEKLKCGRCPRTTDGLNLDEWYVDCNETLCIDCLKDAYEEAKDDRNELSITIKNIVDLIQTNLQKSKTDYFEVAKEITRKHVQVVNG